MQPIKHNGWSDSEAREYAEWYERQVQSDDLSAKAAAHLMERKTELIKVPYNRGRWSMWRWGRSGLAWACSLGWRI